MNTIYTTKNGKITKTAEKNSFGIAKRYTRIQYIRSFEGFFVTTYEGNMSGTQEQMLSTSKNQYRFENESAAVKFSEGFING